MDCFHCIYEYDTSNTPHCQALYASQAHQGKNISFDIKKSCHSLSHLLKHFCVCTVCDVLKQNGHILKIILSLHSFSFDLRTVLLSILARIFDT